MNLKFKRIIYIQEFEYVNYCLSDVLSRDNIFIIRNGRLQKLSISISYYIHRVFRKKGEIKVNKFFFPVFVGNSLVNEGEVPVFMFYEFNILSCDKSFLLYLKRKYPNSKIVLYLTNAIGFGNPQVVNAIALNRNLYDEIISYNKEDAIKYSITYHQWFYSTLENENENFEYDLFFVGGDKGRIEFLKEIAKKCDINKIKYSISVHTSQVDKYEGTGIKILKKPLPYSEYIKSILKSRCLLEFVPNGIMSCTLRTAEAIAGRTKLLTNNINIVKDEVYNPIQMSVFSTIENINFDFINEEVDEKLFNKSDMLSPEGFFIFLENKLFNNAKRIRK